MISYRVMNLKDKYWVEGKRGVFSRFKKLNWRGTATPPYKFYNDKDEAIRQMEEFFKGPPREPQPTAVAWIER